MAKQRRSISKEIELGKSNLHPDLRVVVKPADEDGKRAALNTLKAVAKREDSRVVVAGRTVDGKFEVFVAKSHTAADAIPAIQRAGAGRGGLKLEEIPGF